MSKANLMKAVLCVGLGAFVLGRPAPAEAAAARLETQCTFGGLTESACLTAEQLNLCPPGCSASAVCAHFSDDNWVLSCGFDS